MSRKFLLLSAAVMAAGALAFVAPARGGGRESRRADMSCGKRLGICLRLVKGHALHYSPDRVHNEHYTGTINKFGVDLGYTESSVIIWGVVAPSSDLKPGALEGEYGGVQASASVGIGAGANVLVGGFDKSITLQPLSVEGSKGVNLAAGIGGLTLKYAH